MRHDPVIREMRRPLLTIRQAADLLSMHRNSVTALIKSGGLTAIKAGPKLVRIIPESLDQLLKERRL